MNQKERINKMEKILNNSTKNKYFFYLFNILVASSNI